MERLSNTLRAIALESGGTWARTQGGFPDYVLYLVRVTSHVNTFD